ncbi:Uncharacterized protein ESCO_004126 [Escovopsis weberi]|uniref:FAD-binding domain-containing protein n=1 Tax=Escovopsis weberi TaxID=150374 RepID=A0A0M8MWI2_ESCWE|nr:Uncharacterized protein ESCO_004126 [Escovopsis weberi]
MAALRVLISGAGIAGPSIAFWLSKLGHSCTIFERHQKLRTYGQQIDIRGHGITVVDRMGLKGEIMKHNVDEEGFQLVNVKGERKLLLGRMEAGDDKSKAFTSEIEIMRSDLNEILYNATKERSVYRFGTTVVDYENQPDGVLVTLSDGTAEKFDLVIAADGSNSRIRKMMLKRGERIKDNSRTLGFFVAYFRLPKTPEDGNLATGCMVPKRRFMMTRWHTEEQGQGYLMTRASGGVLKTALSKDVRAQKEAFAQVYDGAGWQANRLIAAMHEAEDFYAEEIVQRRTNIWHSGRVVLLGDAAFAPGLVTGMGTSLAVVGAYVLAGEIGRHGGDVAAGLEGFEKTMRPFVQQAQIPSVAAWRLMWPNSALGVRMLHFMIKAAMRLKVPALMERFQSESKWTLPRYEELLGGNVRG